jgi:hypothetical protein
MNMPTDQGRAEVVDPVLAAAQGQLQRHRRDRQHGQADRQVDVEDPAPARAVGEPATQQRAGHLDAALARIFGLCSVRRTAEVGEPAGNPAHSRYRGLAGCLDGRTP